MFIMCNDKLQQNSALIEEEKKDLSEISEISSKIGLMFLGLNILSGWVNTAFNNWGQVLYNLLLIVCCIVLSVKYLQLSPKNIFGKQVNGNKEKTSFLDTLFLTFFFLSLATIVSVFFFEILYAKSLYFDASSSKGTISPALSILATVVLGPVAEEIQYRGICLNISKKHGKMFTLVTSSLVFALAHMGINIITTFLAGLLLGVLYFVTGSLLWPIIYHMINNSGFLYPSAAGGDNEILVGYTMTLNITILIITFIFCYKRSVFNKLFSEKNIFAQLKADKNKYKAYFSSNGMALYLLIFGLGTISNIFYAIFPAITLM